MYIHVFGVRNSESQESGNGICRFDGFQIRHRLVLLAGFWVQQFHDALTAL